MRQLIPRRTLLVGSVILGAVVVAGAVALVGRTSGTVDANEGRRVEAAGDPAAFVAVAGRDLAFDFEPLRDAADAVERADVIARGTVVDVADGPTYRYPDKPRVPGPGASAEDLLGNEEALASYETSDVWFSTTVLWVEVAEVLEGDGITVGDRIPVHVLRSPSVPFSQVAETRFRAEGLFVMTDETGWQPFDGVVIEWPEGLPTDSLLMPFPDGLWLDGGDEVLGIHEEAGDLGARWGVDPVSLDALVEVLQRAAA